VAARLRRYRSQGLIIPLAISVTAQGAALIGYEFVRPIPKPILTIRLDDAAPSWEFDIASHDDPATAVKVSGPKGFKVTLSTAAGELVGQLPQRFEVSEHTSDVRIAVTAPDGTLWSRRISVPARQETAVALSYTPGRGQVLVTPDGDQAPLVRCT